MSGIREGDPRDDQQTTSRETLPTETAEASLPRQESKTASGFTETQTGLLSFALASFFVVVVFLFFFLFLFFFFLFLFSSRTVHIHRSHADKGGGINHRDVSEARPLGTSDLIRPICSRSGSGSDPGCRGTSAMGDNPGSEQRVFLLLLLGEAGAFW